jgi:TPR repeat protein
MGQKRHVSGDALVAPIGTLIWRERGVARDLEAAVAWYRRAAEAGHVEAQFNLAFMLAEGEGCARDLRQREGRCRDYDC